MKHFIRTYKYMKLIIPIALTIASTAQAFQSDWEQNLSKNLFSNVIVIYAELDGTASQSISQDMIRYSKAYLQAIDEASSCWLKSCQLKKHESAAVALEGIVWTFERYTRIAYNSIKSEASVSVFNQNRTRFRSAYDQINSISLDFRKNRKVPITCLSEAEVGIYGDTSIDGCLMNQRTQNLELANKSFEDFNKVIIDLKATLSQNLK